MNPDHWAGLGSLALLGSMLLALYGLYAYVLGPQSGTFQVPISRPPEREGPQPVPKSPAPHSPDSTNRKDSSR